MNELPVTRLSPRSSATLTVITNLPMPVDLHRSQWRRGENTRAGRPIQPPAFLFGAAWRVTNAPGERPLRSRRPGSKPCRRPGPNWRHEIKCNGCRVSVVIEAAVASSGARSSSDAAERSDAVELKPHAGAQILPSCFVWPGSNSEPPQSIMFFFAGPPAKAEVDRVRTRKCAPCPILVWRLRFVNPSGSVFAQSARRFAR